jgi:hypothetical protein
VDFDDNEPVSAARSRVMPIVLVTGVAGLLGAGAVLLLFGGDDGQPATRTSGSTPAEARTLVNPRDLTVQPPGRRVLIRQGDDAIGHWKVNAFRSRDLLCVEMVRTRATTWWIPMSICHSESGHPQDSGSAPVFGQFVVPGGRGGVVFGAVRSDVARVRIESQDGTDVDETVAKNAVGARFFVANLGVARYGEVTRTAYDVKGRVLEHNVDPPTSGSRRLPP